MGFTSLFKYRDTKSSPSPPWSWPSCTHPRTESFREGTANSVYLEMSDSWLTNSSEEVPEDLRGESLEMVVRGVRSDRLFYEPGDTSSILEVSNKGGGFQFKESVVLEMESEDPYSDFRDSMGEMVTAHGLGDWECLEELLDWYLTVNCEKMHGFIVWAFVDLLLDLASISSSSSFASSTATTPLFSFSSSFRVDEEEEE